MHISYSSSSECRIISLSEQPRGTPFFFDFEHNEIAYRAIMPTRPASGLFHCFKVDWVVMLIAFCAEHAEKEVIFNDDLLGALQFLENYDCHKLDKDKSKAILDERQDCIRSFHAVRRHQLSPLPLNS
jgi:hypothetical protein